MSYCKHCRMLSYYKCGGNMEPPRHVHPIAEWCILGIEVYCGTGQLSFLSPRGGKYMKYPVVSAIATGYCRLEALT